MAAACSSALLNFRNRSDSSCIINSDIFLTKLISFSVKLCGSLESISNAYVDVVYFIALVTQRYHTVPSRKGNDVEADWSAKIAIPPIFLHRVAAPRRVNIVERGKDYIPMKIF